jgi:hypothetical protein
VWPFYYSKADYEICCKVKQRVDPKGVFTANTFVVGYTDKAAPKHVAAAPPAIAATREPGKALDDAAFAKENADRAVLRAREKGIEILRPVH